MAIPEDRDSKADPCLVVRARALEQSFGEFPNGAQIPAVDARIVVLVG